MTWAIAGGPDPSSPTRGQRAWVWHVASEDGEGQGQVEVIVSDLAKDTTHARAALNSSGRVAVEDVLGWRVPPQRIRCTLVGFVVEGGEQ